MTAWKSTRESDKKMMAGDKNLAGVEARSVAITAEYQAIAKSSRRTPESHDKLARRIAFQPAEKLFSPAGSLVWMIGLLGVGASIAPWIAHGWAWFELVFATVVLLASYDALTLW